MYKKDELENAGASVSSKSFSKYYDLTNKLICNGDIFELRQIKHKKSGEMKQAKIYRKSDLQGSKKQNSELNG